MGERKEKRGEEVEEEDETYLVWVDVGSLTIFSKLDARKTQGIFLRDFLLQGWGAEKNLPIFNRKIISFYLRIEIPKHLQMNR